MKPQDFFAKVAPMAIKSMQKTKILASVTIAQAILESGWGDSGLTKKANALFGIKADKYWTGRRMDSKTFEVYDGVTVNIVDSFRAYDSWETSVDDHSAFITGVKLGGGKLRYQDVIGETDYKKACIALQTAGYATALNYSTALIKLIEQYKLNEYDKQMVQSIKPPVGIVSKPPVPVEKQYYIWAGKFDTKERAMDVSKQITALNCYNEVREV